LDFGPGYRVYFALDGTRIVVLLIGGERSTQQGDIRKAQTFWRNYQED
jgi:putative addiction module killer protein